MNCCNLIRPCTNIFSFLYHTKYAKRSGFCGNVEICLFRNVKFDFGFPFQMDENYRSRDGLRSVRSKHVYMRKT